MNENALIPYGEIERMGGAIAKSGLFGVKTADQAIALMLVAQAEGKHPATAAMEYHIIQNRPAMKADQMLARFQRSGGSVKWIKRTDTDASAEFSHAQGGSLVVTWTMERAKKADLEMKDNWKKYPAQMLSARVVSEGVRAVFPAACGSFYTPEEVQDSTPIEKKEEDVPRVVVEEAKQAPKPEPEPEVKTKPAKKETEKVEAKPVLSSDVAKPIADKLLDSLTLIGLTGDMTNLLDWTAQNTTTINGMPEVLKAEIRTAYRETSNAILVREDKAKHGKN